MRGDGRVLQYQGIVLPDGGRMLTYFDITPIKQAQAWSISLTQHSRAICVLLD